MENFERFIATFSSAGVDSRRKQVEECLGYASTELNKRDQKNPDYETHYLAELKKRSLNCDKLLRSNGLKDSNGTAEFREEFGWLLAALENLCMVQQRSDLLEVVDASA